MRLYSFVNAHYLKEVQWGIQTTHVLQELHNKYNPHFEGNPPNYSDWTKHCLKTIFDWGRNYKEVIVLNGGNCAELEKIYDFLLQNERQLKLPYTAFNEDKQSLNEAITSVGVIVPRTIYDVEVQPEPQGFSYSGYELDDMPFHWDNPAEEQFYKILKSKPLAR